MHRIYFFLKMFVYLPKRLSKDCELRNDLEVVVEGFFLLLKYLPIKPYVGSFYVRYVMIIPL